MDQRTNQIFFALLRSAICGTAISDEEKSFLTTEVVIELLKLAEKHDVAHLISLGLKKNGLQSIATGTEETILKAIYRFQLLNYEYNRSAKALEEAKIKFMPLKGSVLRTRYPEPWMRTSCDIDILVDEFDVEYAANVLTEKCGYVRERKGSHDISFVAPNRMHIELHYNLVEDGIANGASEILSEVWQKAYLTSDSEFKYEMPDDMFYFYHIAHMAKHFENGGCGIRPFIDILIMDKMEGVDLKKRDELLCRAELSRFANAVRKLSDVWFNNAELDEVTRKMENYIIYGGVYGNSRNRIILQQQKKGGRLKYALSRIVLPYDIIKFHYPILQEHKWMLPFMQIRRWFRILLCGRVGGAMRELTYNSAVEKSDAENMRVFLCEIGLKSAEK